MIHLPGAILAWSIEPIPSLDLALGAALYVRGYARLRRRAGGRAAPSAGRAAGFAAGLLALGLAFFSPLDTFDGVYFFVHMLQHLVIAWVAPPLLWLGAPLTPLLWGLPDGARRRLGRWFGRRRPARRLLAGLTAPVVSLAIFLLVVGLWHLPTLYDAAQGHTAIHDLEHLSFFLAGLLYWWPVVQPAPGRRLLAPMGGGLLYVLVAGSEGGLLGGVFAFSDRVVYRFYLHPAVAGGLSPVADQQLAGLVMWFGGGLISVAAAFILVAKFLAEEDRRVAAAAPSRPGTG